MANNKKPIVILMEPQMGENIGAAARSMKNFGLSCLRLVNPRDGWPNPKATEMAKSAQDVIEATTVFPSLAEACHDIHTLYATTARPRGMIKPEQNAQATALTMIEDQQQNRQPALLFGAERSGLDNQAIALANSICTIPVSDIYPSLNLAQAVTITCYEWFQQQQKALPPLSQPTHSHAEKATMQHLFDYIESELDDRNYFKIEEKRASMRLNLYNIFARITPTDQEVQTLQGIIRSLATHQRRD